MPDSGTVPSFACLGSSPIVFGKFGEQEYGDGQLSQASLHLRISLRFAFLLPTGFLVSQSTIFGFVGLNLSSEGSDMRPAEFEEREYETPLYNQLSEGTLNVWAPGQVFEGRIGIDWAVLATNELLFRLHGYHGIPLGVDVGRYPWPRDWFRRRQPRQLPDFRLNLFVQAKRPFWGCRLPVALKTKGLANAFWKFETSEHQQLALEKVAAEFKRRALVVYAAPAFHEARHLFLNTRRGTIVQNSTFPSVSILHDHVAWYYDRPGATGVANPDPHSFEEPSLEGRLREMAEESSAEVETERAWGANLMGLEETLVGALRAEGLPESSRRAAFFDGIRMIRRMVEGLEQAAVIRAYLSVASFAASYGVDWLVVGS